MKYIIFLFLICIFTTVAYCSDIYESVYQLPLVVEYYSAANGKNEIITYKGYKQQFNPNDTKLKCRKDIPCPPDMTSTYYFGLNLVSPNIPKNYFKYYIPRGTIEADLSLYGPPTYGKIMAIARFGKPPISDFPAYYQESVSNYTLKQLTDSDCFFGNEGGLIHILGNIPPSKPLNDGNWLYIKYKSYDEISKITVHAFSLGTDKAVYSTWYKTVNWEIDGDPINQTLLQPQWVKIPNTTETKRIVVGKLDDDNVDDLVGVWTSGLWVRYSMTGAWINLTKSVPSDIAIGDLDDSGKNHILGVWPDGIWSW